MLTPLSPPVPDSELAQAIQDAIETERREWSAVKHGRRRQSPLFGFVRVLRQFPPCDGLTGQAVLNKVLATLKHTTTTLNELFPYTEDPAVDFLYAWRKSKMIGMFARAVSDADAQPRPITHTISPTYTRFLRICQQLQRRKGAEPFILSVSTFAATLDVDRRTITRYKLQAEADGLLTMVSPGSRLTHTAGRYHYANVP